MVHVDVELGAALLEPALVGRLVRDEVVVQPGALVHLQHQAALLVHVGLVGDVGDPRHVTHAAPVIRVAQPPPTQRPAQLHLCNIVCEDWGELTLDMRDKDPGGMMLKRCLK